MSNEQKPYRSVEVELSVPFHDLDPLHIVWHGNSEPQALFFDLWIDSDEGGPCETLRGLRMQDVSGVPWMLPQSVIK